MLRQPLPQTDQSRDRSIPPRISRIREGSGIALAILNVAEPVEKVIMQLGGDLLEREHGLEVSSFELLATSHDAARAFALDVIGGGGDAVFEILWQRWRSGSLAALFDAWETSGGGLESRYYVCYAGLWFWYICISFGLMATLHYSKRRTAIAPISPPKSVGASRAYMTRV